MSLELLVQFLVLAATAALFWRARRDLASRAGSPSPAAHSTEELEQLCGTLEALVTDLSRRLSVLERQGSSLPAEISSVGARLAAPTLSAAPLSAAPVRAESAAISAPAPDPQYAPVYALMEAGVTDPQEVARRTGLSRGEVDLILSLRARQVL